ncbi:hypothetical protein [Cytobacillus oceanisediminis]|uniref:hypothetical protein n=1 Tax=Cytobacillus oceanisediminis TaxID=665099 RepID=UPI001FB24D16|nr:hypothetical protein [Cytobacillus oceanisediminis]UOE58176.1 hypothetical protein IRB79_27100 [Cytobacillus oceanisediminis]
MSIFRKKQNSIVINGKSYSGSSVQITNNSIIIDGAVQESGVSGIVSVKVEGDVADLTVNSPTTIYGNVLGNVKVNGSLACGDVAGDVKANGSLSMRR